MSQWHAVGYDDPTAGATATFNVKAVDNTADTTVPFISLSVTADADATFAITAQTPDSTFTISSAGVITLASSQTFSSAATITVT